MDIINKKSLDIYIKYSGLGDSLFYTHVPRIAKENGIEKVRVHIPKDVYHSAKAELIWSLNPYVDEISINSRNLQSPLNPKFGDLPLLDQVLYSFNLKTSGQDFEPELYYKPTVVEWLKDACLYDGNYISGAGILDKSKIEFELRKVKRATYVMKHLTGSKNHYIIIENSNEIAANSLANYFDFVYSAQEFYCVVSGGATLRAAFGKKATVFYGVGQYALHRHSKLNEYIDVTPDSLKGVYGVNYVYKVLRKLKLL